MVVPSFTDASSAGATSSWLFREIPWSCRTSPTVSPLAVTWSTCPSTFRVTSLPIEAYPTVVPTTATAATAAAPTRAILLLLIRARCWRTALQTSYSPGLGWRLTCHLAWKGLRVAHTARSPRRRFESLHPIPANSHQTLRTSGAHTQNYGATCDGALVVRNPRVTAGGGEITPGRTPRPTRADRPFHQGPPNARAVFSSIARHRSARSSPRVSAIARTVTGTRYDALGRPRHGVGVRNGASVSTSTRSSGVTPRASRTGWAFLKVTVPAKLSHAPRSRHARAKRALPEKQCITHRSGAPSASITSRISSCASRSWTTSVLPSRRARSMCRAKDST